MHHQTYLFADASIYNIGKLQLYQQRGMQHTIEECDSVCVRAFQPRKSTQLLEHVECGASVM